MPYADPLKRKEYMREYHLKRKLETKPEPKPEPVNDSWSTKVYEGPPIAETKDMEDIVSGMTQRELNKINEDIQDALEPKEIPERYSRLKTEALSRIKLGESGLIGLITYFQYSGGLTSIPIRFLEDMGNDLFFDTVEHFFLYFFQRIY